MKDNDQSANLAALVDAGIRSFKIEGRYKDMGYVKNITAHYRKLLDRLIEDRQYSDQPLARSSSGSTTFTFEPDPNQNFNREFTDYFVQGRQIDIGAFDTPKNPGQPIGYVTKVNTDSVELELMDRSKHLSNGDGLCYYDLQKNWWVWPSTGPKRINAPKGLWRVFPKDPMAGFKDLRKGVEVNRNRDVNWTRMLDKKSSDRRIGVWAVLTEVPEGIALTLTDEDGFTATARTTLPRELAKDTGTAMDTLKDNVGEMGATMFAALDVQVQFSQPWFVPASVLNPLRREAVEALEARPRSGFCAFGARSGGGAAGRLPRRHTELPRQRLQPGGPRLLRQARRQGDCPGLRGCGRAGRSEPDDHQALRALLTEFVPQAGQRRDRCARSGEGGAFTTHQRQRKAHSAL